MHPKEPQHDRTQFQVDRVAFFSDAVIAIALTLMVLEIKIPEMGRDITFNDFLNRYGGQAALHVIALFVGFSTIGNLWIRHHELFEHINNFNERMVRINLYFLLSVMLLPISIQFLFASNEPFHFQMLFYFLNLFFSSLMYSLLTLVIYSKKHHFSSLKDPEKIRKFKENSLVGTVVFFVVTVLIAFYVKQFYLAFLIFPGYRLYQKFFAKKEIHRKSLVQ